MIRKLTVMVLLIVAFGVQRAAAQACTLSVTNLNFGTYTGTLINSNAIGTVTCNGSWNIPMYTGTGAGATETTRYMTGPNGAELSYRLFTNASHTTNWGNTSGNEVTGSGNATVTVYGQLAASQVVPPGTYVDTMTTATTTFQVTAVITATCTMSATALSFGIDKTSAITVTCTNLTPFSIGLSVGNGAGSTVTTRKMTGPSAATLSYSMFRDTGRTLNWGNTAGTDTLQATATGSAVQYTVYGRIPAGQFPRPGAYTDTIIATTTY